MKMTKEETLQQVESKIRELLPELMELDEGCTVILGGLSLVVAQRYEDEYLLRGEYPSDHEVLSGAEINRRLDNYYSKIIGHKIILESVLKVLGVMSGEFTNNKSLNINFAGLPYGHYVEFGYWQANKDEVFAKWQLGKTLDQQNPEVWEFLYTILCNQTK